MQRIRSGVAIALAVCVLSSKALAHGGTYQPPPPAPPPADHPGDPGKAPSPPPPPPPPPSPPPPPPPPATPGGGDGGGPTTGGGDGSGPSTGGPDVGGTPTTGGGPSVGGGGPSTGGPDAGSGPSTGSGGPDVGGTGGSPPPSTPGGKSAGSPPPGPSTGGPDAGGSPSTPDPRKPKSKASGIHLDHWTRWWYPNRLALIDGRGRVREREVVTPSAPGQSAPISELWRAEAQEALVLALSDPDNDVASGAAVAIGKAGDPSDAPPLVALLGNTSRGQETREAAALALGLLPPETGTSRIRTSLEIVASDAHTPQRLRGFAIYALGLRGESAAVPFLLDSAQENGVSWDVPAAGATALGLSRCALTREDLERMLEGPKTDRLRKSTRRVYAAHGLARLGDAAAVPALRNEGRDDDVNVRRAVILALGALAKPDDDATTNHLCHVLHQDKDRACRNMAAVALGRIGAARAMRELRWAYDNGDSLEQPFAALGIGLASKKGKDADTIKMLRRDLVERGNNDLRAALVVALGLAGDLESAPAIRKIAAERGDPEVRAQAAMALGLMGDRDGAPTILRSLLRDSGSPATQREAAYALGMLGDAEAVKILLDLVADGSSVYVQGSAAVALGRIGGPKSASALSAMLKDRDRPGISRAMAAVALGLLLDRSEGRRLAAIGADLDWYALTPTVLEILDIL